MTGEIRFEKLQSMSELLPNTFLMTSQISSKVVHTARKPRFLFFYLKEGWRMSKRFQTKIVISEDFRSLSPFKNWITKSRDQNFKNQKNRNGQNVALPMIIEAQKRSLRTLHYLRNYRLLKNTVIFTLGNCPRPYICNRSPDNSFVEINWFYTVETLFAQLMKKIKNRWT